jgi:copper resistance protein B
MRFIYILKSTTLLTALLVSFTSSAFADDKKSESNDPPPWSMADKYWGAEAMAKSREMVQKANGAQLNYMVMADRFEFQSGGGEDTLLWDAQAWYGGDVHKLWIKSEGEYSFEEDEVEDAEIQALWSRAIAPFWDIQAGLRYDLEPKGRTHAVLGLQGLAPYWFEIDAAGFLSTDGDLSARVEVEYDLHLNQRLVLQPRAEIEFSTQDIPELNIGSGVTGLDAGLRLRYEIKREFAPYVGVEWQKSFGDTANFTRADGGDADKTVLVLGLRTWF